MRIMSGEEEVKEAEIGKAAVTNHIMSSKAQFKHSEIPTASSREKRTFFSLPSPLCN